MPLIGGGGVEKNFFNRKLFSDRNLRKFTFALLILNTNQNLIKISFLLILKKIYLETYFLFI